MMRGETQREPQLEVRPKAKNEDDLVDCIVQGKRTLSRPAPYLGKCGDFFHGKLTLLEVFEKCDQHMPTNSGAGFHDARIHGYVH